MNSQPYLGNNANQFQPTTDNPQTTQTNLQPTGETTDQPTTDTGLDQQSLPTVRNLKVVVVQDGSSSQISKDLTPVQAATQTWIGPMWGIIFLLIIGLTALVVRFTLKKDNPELSEKIEKAIKEPEVSKETEKKSKPAKPKKTKKHASKKKTTRKRKKKN